VQRMTSDVAGSWIFLALVLAPLLRAQDKIWVFQRLGAEGGM
jgi:hypothetical protein